MSQLSPPVAIDPQVNQVITKVLDGSPLRDAVKASGLTPQLFHYRLSLDKASAVAYARAAELRADFLADETLHIADNEPDAAKARNQITVRQWLASKLNTKRYGDRIDLNVTQTIDIGSTLAEARARLLPVRDQSNVIDVQAVDSPRENNSEPSDKQSVIAPGENQTPDIFS